MNKTYIFLLVVGLTILVSTIIIDMSLSQTTFNEDVSEYPYKVKETHINRLIERQKNLEDTVADLESKVRILNKYLNYKHLEYIDSCNLVERKSK